MNDNMHINLYPNYQRHLMLKMLIRADLIYLINQFLQKRKPQCLHPYILKKKLNISQVFLLCVVKYYEYSN